MWSRENIISEWEDGLRREHTWTPGPILSITLSIVAHNAEKLTVCSENQDVDKILEDYDISCIGKLNIDYTSAIEIDVETQDLNENKLITHLMMICHHWCNCW